MDSYEKIILEIKNMIGKGRRFEGQSDLAKACGLSDTNISRYLGEQRGKGFDSFLKLLNGVGMITHPDNVPAMRRVGPNAPEVAVEGEDVAMIPVMGAAGAGPGQFATELVPLEHIPILKSFIHPGLFACKINGDSMEPVIMDGGYVGVIPPRPFARRRHLCHSR